MRFGVRRCRSVFERELPDGEIVISQPIWPAYLTAERIDVLFEMRLKGLEVVLQIVEKTHPLMLLPQGPWVQENRVFKRIIRRRSQDTGSSGSANATATGGPPGGVRLIDG